MVPETTANHDMPTPRITRYSDGIAAVDAEYIKPGHAAVHIIEQNGRGAFVDTGTNFTVPYLLEALAQLQLSAEAIDYVLLTHVHLDHAGGAGAADAVAAQCPGRAASARRSAHGPIRASW